MIKEDWIQKVFEKEEQNRKDLNYLNDKFTGKEIKINYFSPDKAGYWWNKIIIVKIKGIINNPNFRNRPKFRYRILLTNKNFPDIETSKIYNIERDKEDIEKLLNPLLNCTVQKIDYLNNLIKYKLAQGKK